jgi:uncharacterized protein (DUF2141 family)
MNNMKSLLPGKLTWPLLLLALSLLSPIATHADETLNIRPQEAPDACNARSAQVRITVNNMKAGGVLNVELYDDPDNFLFKKGRKRKVRIPAADGQQKVCMNLEQPGPYAVAVYHDIDANRKLKKRWNLLPEEPFGLSNNPKQQTGFPKFSDSAFTTGKLGADIVIDLQQPPKQ